MPTLQYDFAIIGQSAINAAFSSLEARMRQHNREIDRMIKSQRAASGLSGRNGLAANGRAPRLSGEQAFNRQIEREMVAAREKGYAADYREFVSNEKKKTAAALSEEKKRQKAEQKQFAKQDRIRKNINRRAIDSLKGIGQAAFSAIALGGGIAMAAGIHNEIGFRGKTAALAVQAYNTPAAGGKSREQLQSEIDSTARSARRGTGFSGTDIVGAMSAFHERGGNIEAAKSMSGFFADMANASGAELNDIGYASGQLFMNAMRKGMQPEEAKKAVEDVISAAAGQAKTGAIELKDVAKIGSAIFATSGLYAGDIDKNAKAGLTLAQLAVAQGGASSAREAATGFRSFTSQATHYGTKLEGMGAHVFEPGSNGTRLRGDIGGVALEVVKATKGNLPLLMQMLGQRGFKAVSGLQQVYAGTKGSEADKIAAMKSAYMDIYKTTMSRGEVGASARFRADQPDKKLSEVWNDLTEAAGKELTPAMIKLAETAGKLVPTFGKLVDAFSDIVSWAADNPFSALGAAIGASIIGSIVKAGIGEAIANATGGAISTNGGLIAAAAAAAIGAAIDQALKLAKDLSELDKDQQGEALDAFANAERQGGNPKYVSVRGGYAARGANGKFRVFGSSEEAEAGTQYDATTADDLGPRGFGPYRGGIGEKPFSMMDDAHKPQVNVQPIRIDDGHSKTIKIAGDSLAVAINSVATQIKNIKIDSPNRGDAPTKASATSPRSSGP